MKNVESSFLVSGAERDAKGSSVEEFEIDAIKTELIEILELKRNEKTPPAFNNAEKIKYLKPEVLMELSMDQYISLWKRLNPYFLSHITRQGIRDHYGMWWHRAGVGDYHNGLVNCLEDGKEIRSSLNVAIGLKKIDESSIGDMMNKFELWGDCEKDARNNLDRFLNYRSSDAPRYPDKSSVHFAAQIVSNSIYGSEKDNEIFFVYPADVIASQYNYSFSGWEKDFTKPQSEANHNDIFVWPNKFDDGGIPIDSGIVFLPCDTLVDADNGSRYATKKDDLVGIGRDVVMEDNNLTEAFINWMKDFKRGPSLFASYRGAVSNPSHNSEGENEIILEKLNKELLDIGFSKEDALSLFLYIQFNWREFNFSSDTNEDFNIMKARQILHDTKINWKKSENRIRSQEYWEKYFSTHLEKRPKHIFYYSGNPTEAVKNFQRMNGIGTVDSSDDENLLLGFDQNHIGNMEDDERAMPGYKSVKAK